MIQRPHDPVGDRRRAVRLAAKSSELVADAERKRNAAIRFARDSGASLRDIADATGMSHTKVKRIADRQT